MRNTIYFWLALFWTFVIAVLCLVSFSEVPKVGLQDADKYVHFTFHFVFMWLWFLYFKSRKNELGKTKTIFLVFLLSFLYGISVEIMQGLFTATRKADLFDVLANTSGALTAGIAIVIYQKYIAKEKSL